MEPLAPSLQNVIDQHSLKWIFVGGKGGVGKTTCSCSLAIQLAKVRRTVLIISTDPAHNISDAFNQKFSKTPMIVAGFSNLYAMEVEASDGPAAPTPSTDTGESSFMASAKSLLSDMTGSLPGIDEATSFSQMIKLVQSLDFDVVVFDTAPTGHTLRLLQFPTLIEKSLGRFMGMTSQFMPMMQQLGPMLGFKELSSSEATQKMQETLDIVRRINAQFKDPDMTTFVCVCIAEFLSMYETERLVQELTKQDIDTHNIIVNQLLFPDISDDGSVKCGKCASRHKIQQKYLTQILELYEDFHVTKLPLLEREVRGKTSLEAFSARMLGDRANDDEPIEEDESTNVDRAVIS